MLLSVFLFLLNFLNFLSFVSSFRYIGDEKKDVICRKAGEFWCQYKDMARYTFYAVVSTPCYGHVILVLKRAKNRS